MIDIPPGATLALLLISIIIVVFVLMKRRPSADLSSIRFLSESQERMERMLREEIAQNRKEASRQLQSSREELSNSLKAFGDSLQKQMTASANLQKNQWDGFSRQLADIADRNEKMVEDRNWADYGKGCQLELKVVVN